MSDNSDQTGCAWIIILIAILAVLFVGEPDLHDALITCLMGKMT